MKHLLLSAAVFFAGASAHAAEYDIDPSHSFIEFRIQHLGYSWMLGRFNDISGDFSYDPAAGPEAQSIRITVKTASVDTNHAERDKHLRNEDFLSVDDFGESSFVSTGFTGDENGGVMRGDLTVHGVTRSIDFPVQKVGEGNDPWGGYRAGFGGKIELDRRDFGMDYDLGPTGNSFSLEVFVEGVRR